jgi:phytoene dehydrogenase-like protein
VFEKEPEVGGRAHHIEFAGERVELGGTVIQTDTRRLLSIAKELGVELFDRSGSGAQAGDLVLWDGTRALVRSPLTGVRLPLTLVRRYGPLSLLRLRSLARAAKASWNSVYGLQDSGRVFGRPEDLLDAAGLTPYVGVSLAEAAKQRKISGRLVDEFVTGVLRDMYNQTASVVALSGLVALAGAGLAGGSLVAVAEGNSTLFAKALDRIGANVRLSTPVTAIAAPGADSGAAGADGGAASTGGGAVVSVHGHGAEEFDAVVVAAPLELAGIKIEGLPEESAPRGTSRRYQDVHTTVVAGELTPGFFGPGEAPGDVLTVDQPSIGFKAFGRIGYSRDLEVPIWKFFSGEALPQAVLDTVFRKVSAIHRHLWQAYPVLEPAPRFRPFRLAEGVYQISDFESAVSTLETQATAGWSVADLVARDLASRDPRPAPERD